MQQCNLILLQTRAKYMREKYSLELCFDFNEKKNFLSRKYIDFGCAYNTKNYGWKLCSPRLAHRCPVVVQRLVLKD